MTKLSLYSLLTIAVLFVLACSKDKLPQTALDCDTEVTYNDVKPIIVQSCAYVGCHVSNDIGNFLSYEGMEPFLNNGTLEAEVLQSRTMPPDYADGPKELTQEELDLFQCWKQNDFSKF